MKDKPAGAHAIKQRKEEEKKNGENEKIRRKRKMRKSDARKEKPAGASASDTNTRSVWDLPQPLITVHPIRRIGIHSRKGMCEKRHQRCR